MDTEAIRDGRPVLACQRDVADHRADRAGEQDGQQQAGLPRERRSGRALRPQRQQHTVQLAGDADHRHGGFGVGQDGQEGHGQDIEAEADHALHERAAEKHEHGQQIAENEGHRVLSR